VIVVMRRAAVLAFVLACVSSCDHQPPFRFPSDLDRHQKFHYNLDLEVFKLANGLTVVLAPAKDTNIVDVDVRYEVGSANDPRGQTGIAHFVEHLSFLERDRPGGPTLWDRFPASSLDYNAATTFDTTDYTEVGLAEHWTELLSLEAARMGGTCDSIDDDLFERERAVVLAENAQRGTADLQEPLLAATFGPHHPYGHGPGGHDVPTIQRADVCAFMQRHYAPDHAVLVVSGAIDHQTMRTVIAAMFGKLQPNGEPHTLDVQPLDTAGRDPESVRSTFDQPLVALAYPSPAWGTDDATQHQAAEMLLQEALNYLANTRKDVDDGFVFDVGGKRGGATLVTVIAKKGADLGAIEKALRDAIDKAAQPRRLDAIAIGIWRAYLYAGIVGRYEDLETRGGMIADYLQFTDRNDFQLADLERTHNLSDVQLVAYLQVLIVSQTPLVIRIRPGDRPETKRRASSLAGAHKTITKDLPTTRQPVDEGEADRALAAPETGKAPAFEEITLDNGLRVVFAPRPGSSLFEARMVFPTGSADDPPDAPGTARLAAEKLSPDLERHLDADDLDVLMASTGVGTSEDQTVTESSTVISTSGLAAWAQWHLWELHLRLEMGGYDQASLKDETEESDEDDAVEAQRRAIMAKLFGAGHPYARPSKAAAPDADTLDAFRRAHYVTQGATLIIAGAFDRAAIEKDIRELWGAWPKRAATGVRAVPPAAPAAGPTVFVLDENEASQVRVGIAVLARSTVRDARPARLVARELLDLRLAAIREEMAASYGVYASYHTTAAGDLVEISGDLEPARAGDAIARITSELAALHDHADAERADFVRARRAALAKAMAHAGTAADAADEAQADVAHQLPLDYFARLPTQIGAVSPADVAALLKGDLDPARMVIVVRGPNARAVAEAAKLGALTELPKAKAK
jgi:zinc protease